MKIILAITLGISIAFAQVTNPGSNISSDSDDEEYGSAMNQDSDNAESDEAWESSSDRDEESTTYGTGSGEEQESKTFPRQVTPDDWEEEE